MFFKPIGLNIGGGNSWKHLRWINIDSNHGRDHNSHLDENSIFPYDDSSMSYVFSSHFFEHINDQVTQNLLNESFRILKNRGVIRIITPDFQKAMKEYLVGNHSFFDEGDWGMSSRYENWMNSGVDVSLEHKLAYAFTGYSNMDDGDYWPPWRYLKGYYCGPPIIPAEKIKMKANSLDIHDFSKWIISQLPDNYFDLGHVNCFDEYKIIAMLKQSGFSNIYKSSYGKSKYKALRKKYIDNRPEISMYTEAIK